MWVFHRKKDPLLLIDDFARPVLILVLQQTFVSSGLGKHSHLYYRALVEDSFPSLSLLLKANLLLNLAMEAEHLTVKMHIRKKSSESSEMSARFFFILHVFLYMKKQNIGNKNKSKIYLH